MTSFIRPDETLSRIFNTAIPSHDWTFVSMCTAIEFIKRHNLSHFSDLKPLLERLGIQLHETNQLPKGIQGASQIVDGIPVIIVDSALPKLEKDYTIAHELAHYELHHSKRKHSFVPDCEVGHFAVTLLCLTTYGEERRSYFEKVPEASQELWVLQKLLWDTMLSSSFSEFISIINSPEVLEVLESWLEIEQIPKS